MGRIQITTVRNRAASAAEEMEPFSELGFCSTPMRFNKIKNIKGHRGGGVKIGAGINRVITPLSYKKCVAGFP